MQVSMLATTANSLATTAFGFVLVGLAYVWFRYSVRYMMWTRHQAIRLGVKRRALSGEESLLAVSRWSGAAFLLAVGLLVVIAGLANL
jgi:hypothetical protein